MVFTGAVLVFVDLALVFAGWVLGFALERLVFADRTFGSAALALVFAGASHVAKYTIVNGKIVVENGKLVNIREASATKKANRLSEKMIERAIKKTGIKFV